VQPGMSFKTGAVGLRAALAASAVLMHVWFAFAAAAAGGVASATRAELSGDRTRTTFLLELTAGVTAEIFTLANPYRVIVDLPDVSFRLPDSAGQTGSGLVKAFRFGLFAERKARVVLDTVGPVRIERAAMTGAPKGNGVTFSFDMVTTAPESFGMGTGADKLDEQADKAAPDPAAQAPKPKSSGKAVIMIDPGHGGIDGGAVSTNNVLEKDVVLAVGKELGRQLAATGRYDVRLTRESDVFISLDQRLSQSIKQGVDLFISLHADTLPEHNVAQTIRGATIYTLSERASDEQARRMAEKENASDLVAGLSAGESGDDEVKSILIDLMKRETANFSSDFSNALIRKLKQSAALSPVPQRAAAFKVLKQTHAPSVLIELGYLSHPEDEKLLKSPAWHKKMAASITAAVDSYFAKRTAGPPAR
jgi:N-acetylmuramoyl-L-alanine amidase